MKKIVVLSLLLLIPLTAAAQFRQRPQMQGVTVDYDSHFAFTRIRYGGRGGFFGGGAWAHDYPNADRNLCSIIDYITNMRVRMDGTNVLDLDNDPAFAGIPAEPAGFKHRLPMRYLVYRK